MTPVFKLLKAWFSTTNNVWNHSACFGKFKTQQSTNDHINSLCKKKLYREALQIFDLITKKTTFAVNPSTYANLVLACSSLKSLEQGRKVHEHLLKSNSKPNVILHNHILNMYGKCGSMIHAQNLFEEMTERNLVSWSSMISGYSQNGYQEEAIATYIKMRQSGLSSDHFALGNTLRACSDLDNVELGRQLHCQAMKLEFESKTMIQNALIGMYASVNMIYDAYAVFEQIMEKDIVSWGSMISGFTQQEFELEALYVFREMLSMGCYTANEFILGSVFSACRGLLNLDYGKQIHSLGIKFGMERNGFVGSSLCDMYSKCGSMDSAKSAFFEISNPDLVSWNGVISGFAYHNHINESLNLFSQMRNVGTKPDQITLQSLLSACTSCFTLTLGQRIHAYTVKVGMNREVSVSNTLLTMYSRCSSISDAFQVFNEMEKHEDLVSWNSMLTACIHHRQDDEVFLLVKLMNRFGIKFDYITISSVLSSCSNLASLEMGSQCHGFSLKIGLGSDFSVLNSLINMYAKSGALNDARKQFDFMDYPDAISWTSLIVGYAQFGYGHEALSLFYKMRDTGFMPNHVTFVGVLSACSREGLVMEGLKYYSIMQDEYKISPTQEHCACMIDLFARAGNLKEAENFINQMPFDPDIIVWKSLLSACRIHGNIHLGKCAAENVLKLDPLNSSAYVLLCNTYASYGYWEEVARLRRSMRRVSVKKVPGQSWIKVGDKVHVFTVGEQTHQQTVEIYSVLRELCLHIRQLSYDLDQVHSWDCFHQEYCK